MDFNFVDKIKEEISTTIGIDFDGVIHQNSKGFYDGTIYDPPIEGTKEAIKKLSERFNLVIYTCKANPKRPLINNKTGTELIWEWLDKHNMKSYICDVTNEKPRALFYIDDKVICFKSWKQVLDEVDLKVDEYVKDISKF